MAKSKSKTEAEVKAKLVLDIHRYMRFANYIVAIIVVIGYSLPSIGFKIGAIKPDVSLAPVCNELFCPQPPRSCSKNISDTCRALRLQEYLAPLECLWCPEKSAVRADVAKHSDGELWLGLANDSFAMPCVCCQGHNSSLCQGGVVLPTNESSVTVANRQQQQRCPADWYNDRILPKPIYSPNVGESYWLCDVDWMHEFKGYTYTFRRHMFLTRPSEKYLR